MALARALSQSQYFETTACKVVLPGNDQGILAFSCDILYHLAMIRVGREAGLNLFISGSRPGSTKTTRQSGNERKLVIHLVYSAWLCFDRIL